MADREPGHATDGGPGHTEQTDLVLDLRVPEPLIDLSDAPTVELTAPPGRRHDDLIGAIPSAADYQIIGATGVDAIERRDSLYRARYLAVWLIALLNLADIVTTYVAISMGALEGNPVVAWMIEARVVVLAKILVCGSLIFGAILARLRRRRVTLVGLCAAWAVVGVYALIVLLNTLNVISHL
jgi:hypothetical protein